MRKGKCTGREKLRKESPKIQSGVVQICCSKTPYIVNFQKYISSSGEEKPVWLREDVDALSMEVFKAGLGPEQHDLVNVIPAHGRGVRTR